MHMRIAKRIAEILKQLEQLLGRVIVHGQNFAVPNIVYHKKRRLTVGFRGLHHHYILGRVFDQQMVIVEQLHLPHPQLFVVVEELVEASQIIFVAQLVGFPFRFPEQESEEAMLETVDGRLAERSLIAVHRVVETLFDVVAEASDTAEIVETTSRQLVNVDGLVEQGEDGQRVVVQVETLVVRQADFVGLEVDLIGDQPGV